MSPSIGDALSMIANIFAILGVIFGFFVYFWPVPAASAAICRWLKPMIKWIANCNSILHTSEVDIERGLIQRDQSSSTGSPMANSSSPNPSTAA
ncbi:hypothetical protein NQ176_g3134 [Zarea fungicola]|uniref:Uncharacterized protein n=1 Tax=Zarea fungicola TaxID=93591 RepID=A0ACC1NJY8_9HYPO|nr:hypothetical protein NQ176_g3134 [Lecanicillium fungicola]